MLAIDCEKRKIKVLTNVYIKMSRNLNSGLFKFRKQTFWMFGNLLYERVYERVERALTERGTFFRLQVYERVHH